jgi:hypothetical protein
MGVQNFTGYREGKRQLGKSRSRWEDNARTSLRDVGVEARDWIHQARFPIHWQALVKTVMNIRFT